jgi:transposase InsO family protein
MSWQEKDKVNLRKEFVLQAIKEDANLADLCRRYQISRKTGYKWINRYHKNGINSFEDQSRRPVHSPEKISNDLADKIMNLRQEHSHWGARKIRTVLKRQGEIVLPAPSTIHKILKKHSCLKEEKRSQAHLNRFEHEAPNRLWQVDFKGHFAYEKGRCHPLTVLDDHSRFSIGLKACTNETAETITPLFIEIFCRYGLPERINFDNGNPWGSLFEYARYTLFSKWLIRIGVNVSYSKPHHPQTNGKVERFHRTLKLELLGSHYFYDINHIQKRFNDWRDVYNLERPHEGIGMQVPADRYQPSYRVYPEKLPEINYSEDYEIRKVDTRGRIHFEGRQIFVGVPFAKDPLGIRRAKTEEMIEFFYCHQKLGEVNLATLPKKTIINLYSGRVTDL